MSAAHFILECLKRFRDSHLVFTVYTVYSAVCSWLRLASCIRFTNVLQIVALFLSTFFSALRRMFRVWEPRCRAANDASGWVQRSPASSWRISLLPAALELHCLHTLDDLWLVLLQPAAGVDSYIVWLVVSLRIDASGFLENIPNELSCRLQRLSSSTLRTAGTVKRIEYRKIKQFLTWI